MSTRFILYTPKNMIIMAWIAAGTVEYRNACRSNLKINILEIICLNILTKSKTEMSLEMRFCNNYYFIITDVNLHRLENKRD